jgi:hypothetical protein
MKIQTLLRYVGLTFVILDVGYAFADGYLAILDLGYPGSKPLAEKLIELHCDDA